MKEQRTTGFTLIELLAVLAVIGILVTFYFMLLAPTFESKDRDQARIELAALQLSLDKYKKEHHNYPHCPRRICTSPETLFLSLIGFHNGRGNLELIPNKSLVDESRFNLNTDKYDPAKVPDRAKTSKREFIPYLKSLLQRDIAFVDPWGNPYVYEVVDRGKDYRLYSAGPDGKTGEGFDQDNVELK